MERIVIGVDGSPGSRRALVWGVDEARRRGAAVDAVMAWEDPVGSTWWTVPTAPAIDSTKIEEASRVALDQMLDSIDARGLAAPIEPILSRGHPARILRDAGRGADLLVVGTRGHGGFAGLLLGSISHHLVSHPPCPVVIVPPEDEAA